MDGAERKWEIGIKACMEPVKEHLYPQHQALHLEYWELNHVAQSTHSTRSFSLKLDVKSMVSDVELWCRLRFEEKELTGKS